MCSSVRRASAVSFHLLIFGVLFLTGCSGSFAPGPVTLNKTAIGTIQGNVHGGNFPISGAQIYLFAAGQGGYATSATSLITSGATGVSCSSPAVAGACYVSTDTNGNFTLAGDYTCTEGQQVYMVGVGGNPGLTGTVNNTAIVQMAALGACPASGSLAQAVPYVTLNEVTTVAFGYALSGFATTAYNVSSDASGETALANAFLNANNIVNLWYGQAATTTNWYGQGTASPNGNRNGINPQTRIYALANVLATCVNTTISSSTQCTNLFKYATTSTGTKATDEANAIFNIAHNQAQNVANIFNLGGSTGPFSPTLSSAPADWTMPVIYTNVVSTPTTGGTAITSGPYNIAFDASGNAWIGDRVNGVVEVGPVGAITTYSPSTYGFGMVKGVAISPLDSSVWVSDYNNNQVDVFQANGNTLTSLQTITKNIATNGPILTAFSLNPNAGGSKYLATEANETNAGIVVFDAGTYAMDKYEAGSTGFGNVTTPGWISVDDKGAAWVPSTSTTYLGGLTIQYRTSTGKTTYTASQPLVAASYTTGADGNGNVWVATNGTGTATLYQVASGTLSGSETGGGMNEPYKLVIDGNNIVWIANDGANTISAWNNSTGAWLSGSGFATSAPGILTTGTYAKTSTTVTVASSTGIATGAVVTGAGIPSGTTVSNVVGNTVTLSQATTAAGTNASLAFSTTGCVVIGTDPSGNVWTGNSDTSVTQLLGLSTPTAAPFYGGSTVNNGGTNLTVTKGNLGTMP